MLYPNTEGGFSPLEQNQSVSNQGRNSFLGTKSMTIAAHMIQVSRSSRIDRRYENSGAGG